MGWEIAVRGTMGKLCSAHGNMFTQTLGCHLGPSKGETSECNGKYDEPDQSLSSIQYVQAKHQFLKGTSKLCTRHFFYMATHLLHSKIPILCMNMRYHPWSCVRS